MLLFEHTKDVREKKRLTKLTDMISLNMKKMYILLLNFINAKLYIYHITL